MCPVYTVNLFPKYISKCTLFIWERKQTLMSAYFVFWMTFYIVLLHFYTYPSFMFYLDTFDFIYIIHISGICISSTEADAIHNLMRAKDPIQAAIDVIWLQCRAIWQDLTQRDIHTGRWDAQ